MNKTLKYTAIILLIVAAAYFITIWYFTPIKTEIKDVFWEGPTGGILFPKATVYTLRNGDIFAFITNTTTAITPQGQFTKLKWDEAGQQWLPVYE